MKLKTINIKGKSYVQVNERLKHFREIYQHKFGLTTEILEMTEKVILIKATITCQETGFVVAEGTAMESKDAGFINKDSHIENCETSAWGRALGNFGIGIDDSIASYEEVSTAIKNENKISKVFSLINFRIRNNFSQKSRRTKKVQRKKRVFCFVLFVKSYPYLI